MRRLSAGACSALCGVIWYNTRHALQLALVRALPAARLRLVLADRRMRSAVGRRPYHAAPIPPQAPIPHPEPLRCRGELRLLWLVGLEVPAAGVLCMRRSSRSASCDGGSSLRSVPRCLVLCGRRKPSAGCSDSSSSRACVSRGSSSGRRRSARCPPTSASSSRLSCRRR